MNVWDLHCDTLSELMYAQNEGREISFENNTLQIDLERMKKGEYLLQCFACFVNLDRYRDNPLRPCMEMIDIFYRLLEQYPDDLYQVRTAGDIKKLHLSGKIGAMLTIEEGAVCLDDPGVLRNLYRLGVRMMTLTWNHENGLASPNSVPGSAAAVWPCAPVTDKGLTPRGIEFVEEMERLHMIIDVSHLSDAGFWDVAEHAKRPFAASHSNARSICPHVRNLTDEMIRVIGERGGLIGLNYCPSFVDPRVTQLNLPQQTGECGSADLSGQIRSKIADMIIHVRHLIDVGGEDIVALGSDFDGIEGDLEIAGPQDMPRLAQAMEDAGISRRQIEKIFWRNAERFFTENL